MFHSRWRRRSGQDEEVGVEMSSLIDCVFLLLIFFLVTSMMKKLEKQIPVTLPSGNASVAARAEADTRVIGLDAAGRLLVAQPKRNRDGNYIFRTVSDVEGCLNELARKPEENIRICADGNVEFQKVIDLLDRLQIKGCGRTDVRMIDYGSSRDLSGEEVDR